MMDRWLMIPEHRQPTPTERRVWVLWKSGLDTTKIAEWMGHELHRPMQEAEAYNALGMAQFFHYVGVLK